MSYTDLNSLQEEKTKRMLEVSIDYNAPFAAGFLDSENTSSKRIYESFCIGSTNLQYESAHICCGIKHEF